jgi:hypothetical protein
VHVGPDGIVHRIIRIILTVGHVDHHPEHNQRSNLRAWCQRCHLRHDALHHRRNAHATRRAQMATGDLFQVGAPISTAPVLGRVSAT